MTPFKTIMLASIAMNAFAATATPQLDTLLESLPKTEYSYYSKVELDIRTTALLSKCEISKVKPEINSRNPNLVAFDVTCKNGKTISLSSKTDGKIRSLVAKNHLKRKTRLNHTNTQLEWVPMSDVRGEYLTKFVLDNHYIATRNLKMGQPINMGHLDVAPTVERGWEIKAQSNISNITIGVDVKALEDGIIGETIKVQNLKSGSIFYAKIFNSTTVTIE
ncbi:flagellar basal body P-ring formation chaperone FlgA [Vibrio coralliirubri]|uniref:flagellar basal body P-ring formation chaperone FlgA n=1 Tax=Vibrio coralliirubri TaxID=1516159 RepID=UPI0022837637|nr:flagellar basal body P-ring formation chaperone FlgA [Vibrio coralliirubri]MCY9860981.1 flagellar basal body P-ring formation chaperone FlgA [Vibrio coralliirubri]